MDFTSRYKKLNSRQKEAVDHIDGPLMVLAGPGTGKTELLSMRAANILHTTDTLPENILCLTFTESGAMAMRKRLEQIIGPDAYKVAIHTFHSFGSDTISRYSEYFYQGANFRPADELSSYELLRTIFSELDYNNPLASKMNGEYTYLADVLNAISELKKSGLTNDELLIVLDANEQALDIIERDLAAIFSDRISTKTLEKLTPLAQKIAKTPQPTLPPGIQPLANVLALSLAHAVDEASDSGKTTAITSWKNSYMEKNEAGEFVFKDRKRIKKLRALSYIYYQYLVRMQEAELYDFDDMVLRVVHAMEVFPDLRYNLQEKYQYIMVDEFQDTNLAQSRILYNLTNYESGDAPNLMIVGDDDQAIYSFQGAEISNILNFHDQYETVKLVTLTDNYRSAAPILQQSRAVITQGVERLERIMDSIDKTLTAQFKYSDCKVELYEYQRIDDERSSLVASIQQQIESGVEPASITVLARRHHELVSLLPHFINAGVAVNYERRDNVLDAEVVQQLELVAKVVHALAIQHVHGANELLPRLLAHPAWGIASEDIWKLSIAAHKNHSLWIEEMAVQPTFSELHTWLIEQARVAHYESAEHMLDSLLGSPESSVVAGYRSPLFDHFFSAEQRESAAQKYITYLEALRTIRAKLREYRPNTRLQLAEFLEFIELHRQLGSSITSVHSRSENMTGAVNLMTAHRAKGLEFDHVYIHGAIDTSWGARVRSRSRMISYPENLPLSPVGDTLDERLRLFFVAMTRARKNLFISYSLLSDTDKETICASFLTHDSWQTISRVEQTSIIKQQKQLLDEWYRPLVSLQQSTMKELLAPTLERYKLSATHLNNFLDVSSGGPQYFLLNNLLRFPQSMNPSAAFGSAVHSALQRAHSHLSATNTKKPVEDVLHDFEKSLREKYLSDDDFNHFLKRGIDALQAFLHDSYGSFAPSQRSELSFASQESRVGDASLTGALDVVTIDEITKTIIVTDYKTGKSTASWRGKTEFEKIKLHKYKQQLMFYKLLVENSRDWHGYSVQKGVLQYVEPSNSGKISRLELEFDDIEMHTFSRLVQAVYHHIVTLDLSDITHFSPDYQGILDFESSLT